jgi:uncharacterized protein (DUF934 family)
MPNIIRNAQVVADNWSLVDPADGALPDPLPGGDLLVPLAVWQAHRARLLAHARKLAWKVGIRVDGNEEPAAFAADLEHFSLIAIRFPQFGDGRGYSLARLLRERYAYRGELRAVGDVIRDNLFFLAHCGFDAFDLNAGTDLQAALASLSDFSESYQTSVAQPRPLFRRRLAGAST